MVCFLEICLYAGGGKPRLRWNKRVPSVPPIYIYMVLQYDTLPLRYPPILMQYVPGILLLALACVMRL